MKRFWFLFSLSLALLTAQAIADPVVIDNETQMGDVQAHGGGMIKVGDFYYWVGAQYSDDGRDFVSYNIYRSSDLKNWTFRNRVISPQSDPVLSVGKGGRPKLLWNAKTQRYVLWFKWYNAEPDHCAVVAQSDTVDGKYTFVRRFLPEGNEVHDCTLFGDDDGTAYFISNGKVKGEKVQTMNLYKLTPDYLNVEKTVSILPWKREAPALFKRNGVYFLVTSGRSGWKGNQQKYVTARSLSGPWSDLKDVGARKGYDGQTTFVQPISGSETTSYLWMSDVWRQPEGGTHNSSDYKWLPLSFPDDETMEMQDAKQISVDVATGVVAPAK